jgi:hypothetical protein
MFGNTNLSQGRTFSGLQNIQDSSLKKMYGWLSDLHSALNRDRISTRELDILMKQLDDLNANNREDYVNTLLYPESVFGKKIPCLFPIPSTTFQLHLVSQTISTNSSGNVAFTYNPVFLQDSSATTQSTFYINNNVALTGSGSSNFFLAQDLQYNQIPANLYGNYRIVSASIVLTYIGRIDIVSGVVGVGIGLNNSGVAAPQAIGATDANSAIFGNFVQVDNLYFSERTQSANGARAIYFPIDDRYTNFLAVYTGTVGVPGATLSNCFTSSFYFAGYGQGLPISSPVLRFDFYINVEAVVTPQFNNFIPQTTAGSSSVDAISTAANELMKHNSKLLINNSSDIPGPELSDVSTKSLITNLTGNSSELPSMSDIRRSMYK